VEYLLFPKFLWLALLPGALLAQDAANINKPSQSDMLVGTRVPRDLPWSTPTNEERMRVLRLGLLLSPGAYLRSTFTASTNHLSDSPRDYGQGWAAYGKRNANSFLTYSLQDAASQGFAALSHYEMRYIQCKCTGVLPRIGHAIAFNFVTFDQRGKKVFNWPSFAGGYAAGILSTLYTPNQKWSAEGIQAGNNAIMFGFVSSLMQEFIPSKIFSRKKKTPPANTPNPHPKTAQPATNPDKSSSQ